MSDVNIKMDDRIRLMSTVLAGTNFPDEAQARKRHHPHAHARATLKYIHDKGLHEHPAVQSLQILLDRETPLEAMYTLIMYLPWHSLAIDALPKWVPENWNVQLREFYEQAKIQDYWNNEARAWENAENQASKVFENVHFKEFLEPFVGEFDDTLTFMPNLCFPADREIGIRVGNELFAICPPPLAWGDSPPWPYDEESMYNHSYRGALTEFGRLLLTAYLRANPDKVAKAAKKKLPVSDQFASLHPLGKINLSRFLSRRRLPCTLKITSALPKPKPIS